MNEKIAINMAAVQNAIGRTFGAGQGKVIRAERDGLRKVWAVVACTTCGNEHHLPVATLGTILSRPDDPSMWSCKNVCKPSEPAESRTKPESEMSADEYRREVEAEFSRTRKSSAPAEEGLRRQYPAIYRAAIRTGQESKIISVEQYIALSAADRKQWDDWASAINGKLQSDYARVVKGFESVGMLNDARFPKTLQDFARLSEGDRAALLQAADRCLP